MKKYVMYTLSLALLFGLAACGPKNTENAAPVPASSSQSEILVSSTPPAPSSSSAAPVSSASSESQPVGQGVIADSIVGEYEFLSMTMDGETMTKELLKLSGGSFTFEVRADGTFEMVMTMKKDGGGTESETQKGTWAQEGDRYTFTVDGDTIYGSYNAADKILTLEEDGEEMELKFKKIE